MKKPTLLIILLFSLISEVYGQSPYWQWAESGVGYTYWHSMATDSAGNVYITGEFTDSIRFDNYLLIDNIHSEDIYIVKYNPTGMVLWARKAGGKNEDISHSIAIDKDGVYITGTSQSDTLSFGNITITNYKGGEDIFIAKYDLNGNAKWAETFGGVYNECAWSICTSKDGFIYITGTFESSELWLGNVLIVKKGSKSDVFIIKLDTSGKAIWGRNANDGTGNCIKTDNKNNVYVTGSFFGSTITFGSYTLTNAGFLDIFIVKYDSNGNVIWAKRAGGNDRDEGLSLDINKFGQIYLGGRFYSSKITFGKYTLNNLDNSNVFLTKYDSLGNVIWATAPGLKNNSYDIGIAVDSSGNIYVAGDYNGNSIRFGNYYLTNKSCSALNSDMFVVKYDTSGLVKWTISPFGIGSELSSCVGIDYYQNIFISGLYQSSGINFCSCKLDSIAELYVFVAKLGYCSIPKPIISILGDTTFCQGDSVVLSSSSVYGNLWPDSSKNTSLAVKKSGIYSVTVTDSFCCSATSANVHIKVLSKPSVPTITFTGDTTFCSGDSVILSSSKAYTYLWSDSSIGRSVTVKNTGNYSLTISDSFGCMASSRQVNIRVHPAPMAGFNINLNPQTLVGNNFIFTNTSTITDGSPLTYFWDFGDGDTSTAANPIHSYALAGTYNVKLIAISDSGCTDTLTVTVLVLLNPGLVVSFTVQNACVWEEVIFKNTSTLFPPDSFLNFLWDFGDGSTIVKKEPKHIYSSAGKYIIRLFALTAFGLKDTLIDTIEIFTNPVVNIVASPDTIVIPGIPVTLTASGLYDQLLWFNNSTTNTVTVSTEGKYWVTASYSNGCNSSDTIILTKGEVKEPEPVNVITPNGDGINDRLVIKNIDLIKPCKLAIYNRWGDELYSSSDYQNNWEGTYKGKKLPEGSYYYVLKTKDGKVYKGAVNILR